MNISFGLTESLTMDKPVKILIVDDDPVILDITRRVLVQAGYETVCAHDGESALQLARQHQPDMMLLDVNLPDIDGFEICRRVKTDPCMTSVYVVMVSGAHKDSESMVKGLDLGADDFISRPITNRELVARINAMLRIHSAERALRTSNAQWFSTFDAVRDAIFLTDTDFNIVKCNRATEQLYNRSLPVMLGQKCYKVVHGSDAPETGCPIYQIQQSKQATTYTTCREQRWLNVHIDPVLDPSGNITGYVHVVSDITERKLAEDGLRESEDKFKYVFENSLIGKSFTKPNGDLEVNSAFCAMLGYSKEELDNQTWNLITHPDDVEFSKNVVNLLLSGKKDAFHFSKRYIHKDGSIIWTELSTSLRRDKDGQPLYFITSVQDITERKRMEEELKESEALKTALLNGIPEATFMLDKEGTLLSMNEAFAARFGRSSVELLGTNVWNLLPAKLSKQRRAIVEQVFIDGKPVHFEDSRQNLIFLNYLYPILDPEGRTTRVVGFVLDITQRRMAENMLHKRLELLEFSTTHSLAEILQKTLDDIGELTGSPIGFYHFVDSDQQYLTLQAWSTRTIQEFCKAESNGNHYPVTQAGIWADCVSTKTPIIHNDYATEPGRKGLPPGHADVRRELVAPILRNGKVVAILGVGNKPTEYTQEDIDLVTYFADIAWESAERKQADEILRKYSEHLEKEVEQRTRQLQDAQEKLVNQEKLAVLGQLAGSIGHELRNPLTVITNAVYFLKLIQKKADEKTKEYLNIIEKETRTSNKIISDLLNFARSSTVEREFTPVSSLVRQTLERYPIPPSVHTVLEIPADIPQVMVDPVQIVQVLGNLAVNAYQAMPQAGQLTISASLQGECVAIAITDTGTGIKPESMKKLFEPLYTTKAKGIGLGLPVCKKLTETNGGRIEVQSEPRKGSTFTIFLPVIENNSE
jgi:PAS domain S-box-containing protein